MLAPKTPWFMKLLQVITGGLYVYSLWTNHHLPQLETKADLRWSSLHKQSFVVFVPKIEGCYHPNNIKHMYFDNFNAWTYDDTGTWDKTHALITVSPTSPFGIVSERNNCLNAAGFGVSHAHVPHVSWKVYVLKCWNCLTLGCSIQPVCTDLARATHANCQPLIAGWFISQHLFLSTLQGWHVWLSTLQNIDFTRNMWHMCMLDFPHIVKHSSACSFLKRFQKDLLGRLLSAMTVGGYISG